MGLQRPYKAILSDKDRLYQFVFDRWAVFTYYKVGNNIQNNYTETAHNKQIKIKLHKRKYRINIFVYLFFKEKL